MTTQYDSIGTRYGSMTDLPAAAIDRPSVEAVLGDITGLDCLDLGCGLRRWSFVLAEKGAKQVIGVDISKAMINAARESAASLPSAEMAIPVFYAADCSKPLSLEQGPFDIVFAAWFLNYAATYEEQLAMWRNISAKLKPGGRFMGMTPNAHDSMEVPIDGRYGVHVRAVEKVEHGWKCELTADTEPERVRFHNYHLSSDVYERAAAEAGLVDFGWNSHTLPDDDRKHTSYWDVYEQRPHIKLVTARKPS